MMALILYAGLLPAQSPAPTGLLDQVRAEIDTLCSPALAGRGYVHEGHLRAARYISNKFQQIGLEPVVNKGGVKSYFQPFPLQINLITDAKLVIGSDTLQPGTDFIAHRLSGSGQGSYKIKDMGYGLKLKSGVKGKIALLREGWPEHLKNDSKAQDQYGKRKQMLGRIDALLAYQPAGFIILKPKLTAAFAQEHLRVPILEVQKDSFPSKKASRAYIEVHAGLSTLESQNVAGLVRGTQFPDTAIVISAHYDHLGMLGPARFPGANDNASGTAMLLTMARYFQQHPLKYSILFIAFGGEETGLIGSRYFVEYDPLIPLQQLKFVLNLDLMGNGDEGIMAVGGKDFPAYFEQLQQQNERLQAVPVVRARRNAPNSDHFFFLLNGVPGFFIYTLGGPPHYHDVNDTPAHLRLSRFEEVQQLLIRFLEQLN